MLWNQVKKEINTKFKIFSKEYLKNVYSLLKRLNFLSAKLESNSLAEFDNHKMSILDLLATFKNVTETIQTYLGTNPGSEEDFGLIIEAFEDLESSDIKISNKLVQLKKFLFTLEIEIDDKSAISSFFGQYDSKEIVLNSIFKRVMSLFENFHRQRIGIEEYFGVSKKQSIRIGDSTVYLDIRSSMNAESLGRGTASFEHMLNTEEHILDEEEIPHIKRSKNLELEEKTILAMFFNSIVEILKSNPEILRTGRVNLFVIVGSRFDFELSDSKGIYFNYRSNELDIFIALRLDKDALEYYFRGMDSFPLGSETYKVIIHELSHSFDFSSIKSSNLKQLSKFMGLDSDLLSPKMFSIAVLLRDLRDEGFATFSEKLISDYVEVEGFILFYLLPIFRLFETNLSILRGVFNRSFDETINSENFKKSIPESLVYDLGALMFWLIFLRRFSRNFSFFMREKFDSDNPLEEIRDKSVKYFFENRVSLNLEFQIYFGIPEKKFVAVKEKSLSFLSRLNVEKFFKEFLLACSDFGINPAPLTSAFFDKLSQIELKNLKGWIKKLSSATK